jgi:hypothetical protein
MSFLNTALATLNSNQVVYSSGFMIGFVYDFKFNKKTLHFPLSTIFNSAISGFFTAIGADIVSGFLPPSLKFIIPVAAIASCIYYKFVDMFGVQPNNRITEKSEKSEKSENDSEEKKISEQVKSQYPFVDNNNNQ